MPRYHFSFIFKETINHLLPFLHSVRETKTGSVNTATMQWFSIQFLLYYHHLENFKFHSKDNNLGFEPGYGYISKDFSVILPCILGRE